MSRAPRPAARPTAAPAEARRRSVLSVPANEPHKVDKALASLADEVLLDLEDAVPHHAKDAARDTLVDKLAALPSGQARRVAVRVNAPRTAWCHQDLLALAALERPPASVVVPKVESAGDLAFVERLLDGARAAYGRDTPIRVQALVETADGLARVQEIAHAGGRLSALVLGYADLAASLGAASAQDRLDLWLPAQHALVVAARSARVQAVDGPHLGVHVDDALARSVRRAAELGFDGKWAIHPRQLETLNAAFTPSEDEVAQATRVLDALARGAASGAGAVQLDGQMLDEAVALAARRVLARSGGEQS